MLKVVFNWLTVVCSGVAAFLWLKSATVSVSAEKVERDSLRQTGWAEAQIVNEDADFVYTARAQARWNRCAAIASCLAALFQAIYTILPN